MKNKTSIMAATLVLAALFTAGCLPTKTTGLPMKVGRYYWPGMYWLEIADKKGWFKDAGLNVELVDANPDYYKSLKDTAEGKIDGNNFYLFDLLDMNMKGADLVAVINTDISNGADAIVAKEEIKSVAGLKGKRIGLTKNSFHEYLLGMVLERSGLGLDDVTVVDMPGEDTAGEFIKGNVDAIAAWEPVVSKAIQKGGGRKLFSTSEIPGIGSGVLAVGRPLLEKRPGDVQAFVNVWLKTTRFIKENPQEAFKMIAEIYKKTPGEVEAFARQDKILDLEDNRLSFTRSKGFESLHGAALKMGRYMIKKGMIDREPNISKFLDDRFIRNVK